MHTTTRKKLTTAWRAPAQVTIPEAASNAARAAEGKRTVAAGIISITESAWGLASEVPSRVSE